MEGILLGDNLPLLRELETGSVQMVYADPPFNTGRTQARKTLATVAAEDGDRTGFGGRRYATTLLQESSYRDVFADYLGFLEPRLHELRRVLAPEGTLYLHLDYREAHYAKLLLDELFGRECFLNELIWAYDYGAKPRTRWPQKHDTILVYVRDIDRYHFDAEAVDREPYMAPGLVTPEQRERGKRPTSVMWHTIVSPTGREKTGYPTQKPEGLVRRFVQASSRPGDLCLDPFAGSGTLGAVAAKLGPALPADRREPGGRRGRCGRALAERVQARGPGRVNLIGEHTDYNAGLALPFAIARGVTVTAEPLRGDRVEAHALDAGEQDEFALAAPERSEGWRGVRARHGRRAHGRRLRAAAVPAGDHRRPRPGARPLLVGRAGDRAVPGAARRRGRGRAGRPARAGQAVLARRERLGRRRDRPARPARLALRRACADRLRVAGDRAGAARARRLVARDARLRRAPLDRRLGLQRPPPRVRARRAPPSASPRCARRTRRTSSASTATLAARARHVLTENARVDAMVAALRAGDLAEAGRLLDASHASLRDDYESSVPAVERTVAELKAAGAAGARMVGGGFGGAVLALLGPGVVGPGGALVVSPGPPAALV